MNTDTITLDELLKEIEAAEADDQAGLSMRELMNTTGFGERRCERLLHEAAKSNRLVVGRKRTTNLIGVSIMVPCYRFLPKARGKKR